MISRKGNIKKDLAIMFNHGDIGEIVCRGYEDDERRTGRDKADNVNHRRLHVSRRGYNRIPGILRIYNIKTTQLQKSKYIN